MSVIGLAASTHLLETVDEMFPAFLRESIMQNIFGLSHSAGNLLTVLLRDSVLQLLSLAAGFVFGIALIDVWGVLIGFVCFSPGAALQLFLLLGKRRIRVAISSDVLRMRLRLVNEGSAGRSLIFLFPSFRFDIFLCLLSLAVCLAGRSGVAIRVGYPKRVVSYRFVQMPTRTD